LPPRKKLVSYLCFSFKKCWFYDCWILWKL